MFKIVDGLLKGKRYSVLIYLDGADEDGKEIVIIRTLHQAYHLIEKISFEDMFSAFDYICDFSEKSAGKFLKRRIESFEYENNKNE